MLAELTVSGPRFSLTIGLKGKGIDEYGSTMVVLDVISAAIFERHAVIESSLLNGQSG
jgi:hypothetical protein